MVYLNRPKETSETNNEKGGNVMARKWTLKEAAEAVNYNEAESLKELMKRYPLLMSLLIRLDEKQGLGIVDAIPDYITPLAMEHKLNGAGAKTADEETDEEAEEAPVETVEEETKADRKRRIDRERQQRKRAKDSDAKKAEEEVEEAVEEEGGPTTGKYDEIGAVELFKICKKRGLVAQPKKSQRYYIDILEAADQADEKAAAAKEEDDEEDWGDEEPSKKDSSPKKSSAKKSSAKKPEPEPEEGDEEDWNI